MAPPAISARTPPKLGRRSSRPSRQVRRRPGAAASYAGWLRPMVTRLRSAVARERTLDEPNVVRSIRTIGDRQDAPLRLNEKFPQGEDLAIILGAREGRLVGASRLGL